MPTPRERARAMAIEAVRRGDPTGWFEVLYAEAAGDPARIQWADLMPSPTLVRWLHGRESAVADRRVLVGCGLGDDAEELARRGANVTAFDISPTAVEWCRRRFPASPVEYTVADLLDPPPSWDADFDLVIEIYTLQVLPPEPRSHAMERLARLLAPGGQLLIIARLRDADEPPVGMPWPLTHDELSQFSAHGLRELAVHTFIEEGDPPVRRVIAEYGA